MNPLVTFVVPCYKLAHLLPECVNSIRGQEFSEWELLIMDDFSPDNTPEVARSFSDPRIKHIRNNPNLGHLRNYNKGIEMARGKYVWLISADDCLRGTEILGRFVRIMEAHPAVGYAFCPGVGLQGGVETGLLKYAYHGDQDFVTNGREFLSKRLLEANTVLAASGMVRKTVYETIGAFPLDMPYAGDWYLWCRFALQYDVAYVAAPSVCYRLHEQSMTTALTKDASYVCVKDDLTLFWRIMQNASDLGLASTVQKLETALAREYCLYLSGPHRRSLEAVQSSFVAESIQRMARNPRESSRIMARVCALRGDAAYEVGDRGLAHSFYQQALHADHSLRGIWFKSRLLSLGSGGEWIRSGIGTLRRALGHIRSTIA